MLDEWFSAWLSVHSFNSRDYSSNDDYNSHTFRYFSHRGDTRDVWESIAEFDDQLTQWIGAKRGLIWRIRPRWTPHFVIECEVGVE